MPSLIDTHSHIYVDRFADDLDSVIARAEEVGVETIVAPATKPSEFASAMELADRYAMVRAAVGVHPHHAGEINDADLEEVERLGREGRVVAIGEIGLDYHYNFAPREIQHEVFRRQLRIAKRLDLPIAVHNRESDDDLLDIIEQEQDGSLRFQLHCFSSGLEVLRRALDLGAMISFTGNITYAKSTLDDVVRSVPDDRIMIETDAPYLTPVPFRGKRNEPGYVAYVAEMAAELRATSLDAIRLMTTENARRFFRLAAFLIVLLPTVFGAAFAQPEPTRTIDTTATPMYEKWLGIGGHFTASTYITGALTEATSVPGLGFWLTTTPLQSLNIDWLQLDFIYTHTINDQVSDTTFTHRDTTTPPNTHNQLDMAVRVIANSRKVISLFGSLGLTYFHNEFGADKYLIENYHDTTFKGYAEDAWGLNGSFGFSVNINTPYGLISPTAEWRVAKILSTRTLPKRNLDFFVSQPRIGVIIYPYFSKLF